MQLERTQLAEADEAPRRRLQLREIIGPGLITGASDDDPSGIATHSQAGARFGYGMCWTIVATYPLMAAVQIISARIGRTTGHGIAGNLARCYPRWLTVSIVTLLVVANTINIGADIGAMADAGALVFGGSTIFYLIGFALFCALTEVFAKYKRYVWLLKWLTLALFAYVATLFMVRIPWGVALRETFIPPISLQPGYVTMIVAIFGTTISPYLFFWQASEEAEEVHEDPDRHPLRRAPKEGPVELERIQLDTLVGMAFSNLVALSIMLTAAAHASRRQYHRRPNLRAGRRGAAADRRQLRHDRVCARNCRYRPARPSQSLPALLPTPWARWLDGRWGWHASRARPRLSTAPLSRRP
jgi:NRAMP (natural resistance-associated macrophage protein)-like metal ion transporter